MKNCYLLTLLILLLFGCQTQTDTNGELKTIDINQAFKQTHSVNLSDIAKSVEIIQFYPSEDTYFVNARSFSVGKKYIMIADDRGGGSSTILICERSGKFVTTIGRKGKGPGEFLNAWLTLMDPSERFIIIVDHRSNKLIKYSVSGEFIKEHKMDELSSRFIFDEARFINDEEFVLVPRRPVKGIDGFASMLVYDLDLNPSGKILPRANDKNLPLFNNTYQTLGESPNRIFFWEPYFDTVYTINADHSTKATHIIGWSKDGPSFDYMSSSTYRLPPEKQYPINFIYSIVEAKQHFFIGGISKNNRFVAAYNKKSEEVFLLADTPICDTASSQKGSTIKNDLFGIEPVHIMGYNQPNDSYISWMRLGWIGSEYDLNCIKNKAVKLPDIRDQLLELAELPDVDNNMVLLLLKAK